VDESKQVELDQEAHIATVRDIGEEPAPTSDDDGNENQETIDDQIERDIQQWKAEAQERRLTLLDKVPIVEMDSWLLYTKWNEVLSGSQHNLAQTYHFVREPDENEPELRRLMCAWKRILERGLNTLAMTDQKDALKWWASPKNECASQRPYELPQNAKTLEKYSRYYKDMICYFIRTAPNEWEDETGKCHIRTKLFRIKSFSN
jgi:hypothetical protein